MKIIEIIEGKFWFFLLLASIFGLVFPFSGKSLSFLTVPLLSIVAFFTYLKVDFLDVMTYAKKPTFILYIVLINLVIIPTAIYWLFQVLAPPLAIGFLLLAAAPSAISSPVLIDIIGGNVSLGIVICIFSNLLAPFTMVLLLYLLTSKVFHIDLLEVFQTLLLISIVPFIIAQIFRKIKSKLINRTKRA